MGLLDAVPWALRDRCHCHRHVATPYMVPAPTGTAPASPAVVLAQCWHAGAGLLTAAEWSLGCPRTFGTTCTPGPPDWKEPLQGA